MSKSFSYTAVDMSGARTSGVMEAGSEGEVRDQLGKVGLTAEHVQEGVAQPPPEKSVFERSVVDPLFGVVNYAALAMFFNQMHAMYTAGVPLVQALDTLGKGSSSAKLKACIWDMRQTVAAGGKLTESMARYPEVWSDLQIALIKAGEEGGVMERSFKLAAHYCEKEVALRRKISQGTFYFKIMLVVVFFFPLLANTVIGGFQRGSDGPNFKLMAFLSDPVVIISVILAIAGAFVFIRLGLQKDDIKRTYHAFMLKVPYFGPTLNMLAMAKFSRGFSALYNGGVPISKSMKLAADACGNEDLRHRMAPAAEWVKDGGGITQAMHRTGAFTPITLDMAHTGETTGNMEVMLDRVADNYEAEADVRLHKLITILPVVLLIIIAIMVLLIVVNFYMQYRDALGSGSIEE